VPRALRHVDEDDGDHEASLQLLESYPGRYYWSRSSSSPKSSTSSRRVSDGKQKCGSWATSSGNFTTAPVLPSDWTRIAELVARYHDLPLGTVDASVVTFAERLGHRCDRHAGSPPLHDRPAENTAERLRFFPDRDLRRASARRTKCVAPLFFVREQKKLAHDQEKLSREQEKLGREQEKLGREQEKLGREQEKLGREQESLVASKESLVASKESLVASKESLVASKKSLVTSKKIFVASKKSLVASNLWWMRSGFVSSSIHHGK
jgi:hypothetical protein